MQGQCQGWHRSGHNVTPAQEGAVRQLLETDGQSALWILRMHNTQATSQDLAQPLQSSPHPTSWGPLSSAWALVDSKSCPGLEGLWLLRPKQLYGYGQAMCLLWPPSSSAIKGDWCLSLWKFPLMTGRLSPAYFFIVWLWCMLKSCYSAELELFLLL